MPQHTGLQEERGHRANRDGHVDQRQAAGCDASNQQADGQGNQESAEPDHLRSPQAVRVMLPTEEMLLSCLAIGRDVPGPACATDDR